MDELKKQIETLSQQVEAQARQIESLSRELSLTYRQSLRLTNALNGTEIFYVADSSGGAVTRKLTFKDGILQLKT